MTLSEAADQYEKDIFAQNPDGFTVAPWCNEGSFSQAFEDGARWAMEKCKNKLISNCFGESSDPMGTK